MSVQTLRVDHEGWAVRRRHGRWDGSLRSRLPGLDNTHELRVRVDGLPPAAVADLADFLPRVIARGTFVVGDLPLPLLQALPAGVGDHVRPGTDSRAGDLEWDIRSVVQRRAALRHLLPDPPPVSLVLVSRRPDLVLPMVRRLDALAYPNLEIVVGLHGAPTPRELAAAAGDRPLVVREFPADQVFGSVLQDAWESASGQLVTKIDDDDYYGDDHVLDLVLAHRYSGATLVGKSTTVVFLEAIDTTVRRLYGVRESFTHRVAGSTFLLAPDDLRAVGGWPVVPRAVDTHLINAVREHGGTIYQPHDIGYLYVRHTDTTGHTWGTGVEHFLRNTREQWIGLLRHPEFGTGGEL